MIYPINAINAQAGLPFADNWVQSIQERMDVDVNVDLDTVQDKDRARERRRHYRGKTGGGREGNRNNKSLGYI